MNLQDLKIEIIKSIHSSPPSAFKELKISFTKSHGTEAADIWDEAVADYERTLVLGLSARDTRAQSIQNISNYLISIFSIKTLDMKIRDVYVYDNGYYSLGENRVRAKIEAMLGPLTRISLINEILEKIRNATYTPQDFFDNNVQYLNFRNGIFDTASKSFMPHSPDYLFLSQIQCDYEPEADCPTFTQFLTEIMDAEFIPAVQEWFGFCLYRAYFLKKALIVVGAPHTGKTTLLNILTHMLGLQNVCNVSLHRFGADKFALAEFHQKLANIFDDLSRRDVKDQGVFKMATGNSTIQAERKFGNAFRFYSYAKLTFSCNNIPDVEDVDDDAYFDRWIIIRTHPIGKKTDPFLEKEMKLEISGVLNFAIDGLLRLLENRKFSYGYSLQEIRTAMQMNTSTIARFAYVVLERGEPTDLLTKDELYNAYTDFMRGEAETAQSKREFGLKITKFCKFINDAQVTSLGIHSRVWKGARIKSEFITTTRAPESVSDLDKSDLLSLQELGF